MKNLEQWRKEIDKFLLVELSKRPLKSIVDIGLGDSSGSIKKTGRPFDIIDKIRHTNLQSIECDILRADSLPSKRWDIVVCCEVFEHIENPFIAAANIYSLLTDSGVILVTVPCNLEHHPGLPWYGDFWRFMPGSIACLFPNRKVTEYVKYSNSPNFPYGICAVIS